MHQRLLNELPQRVLIPFLEVLVLAKVLLLCLTRLGCVDKLHDFERRCLPTSRLEVAIRHIQTRNLDVAEKLVIIWPRFLIFGNRFIGALLQTFLDALLYTPANALL